MRRLSRAAIVLLSFLAFLSALAPAASAQSAEAMAKDDCARARALGKTCELTIDAEEVEGGVVKPEGEVIAPRPLAEARSLIRLRKHFIPEILQSAAQVP